MSSTQEVLRWGRHYAQLLGREEDFGNLQVQVLLDGVDRQMCLWGETSTYCGHQDTSGTQSTLLVRDLPGRDLCEECFLDLAYLGSAHSHADPGADMWTFLLLLIHGAHQEACASFENSPDTVSSFDAIHLWKNAKVVLHEVAAWEEYPQPLWEQAAKEIQRQAQKTLDDLPGMLVTPHFQEVALAEALQGLSSQRRAAAERSTDARTHLLVWSVSLAALQNYAQTPEMALILAHLVHAGKRFTLVQASGRALVLLRDYPSVSIQESAPLTSPLTSEQREIFLTLWNPHSPSAATLEEVVQATQRLHP